MGRSQSIHARAEVVLRIPQPLVEVLPYLVRRQVFPISPSIPVSDVAFGHQVAALVDQPAGADP